MEYVQGYNPATTQQRILCASCGTPTPPSSSNICANCIRNDIDITDGIPKQATIHFCKGCDRYLLPPNMWVVCDLESKELLTLCLKKLRGLSKVRLVDAKFLWTEPHSRRLKVKLTIQKEVQAATILQQIFTVEYIVSGQQCQECTRVAAQLTWKASVQVRQKVAHKRTFLWLEQLILKHDAHANTTNIKEAKDGIDFYYVTRSHAIKMVEFLQSVVPTRLKTSEQLVSQDVHSGSANYKFTYSLEIMPVCKDDLVCLPLKVARNLSNVSPLVICSRVSNSVSLMDPNTLQTVDLRNSQYWDTPFASLCEARELIEFYVIDVTREGPVNGRHALATVEIARSNDLSVTFLVRSHLGNVLKPGDHASGYDLRNVNFNDANFDALIASGRGSGMVPDVILVKKSYPNARKKSKSGGRRWRVKRMTVEEEVEAIGKSKTERSKAERDYELFLRDIEEDKELRGMINLYKDQNAGARAAQMAVDDDGDDNMGDDEDNVDGDDEEGVEEDFPDIGDGELLEDLMEGMVIDDDE